MTLLSSATEEQVVLEWLRSEWMNQDAQADRKLIDSPDLKDAHQNAERLKLLVSNRSPIWDELPRKSRISLVNIEVDDLKKTYILPVFDWYLDTGRTFKLLDTITSLEDGRGYDLGGGPTSIEHSDKVQGIAKRLVGYRATTTKDYIVLIASRRGGPYTIIDGTHRATALLKLHMHRSNMPWRAFLIESPDVAQCKWHIDSPEAKRMVGQLSLVWSQGNLW